MGFVHEQTVNPKLFKRHNVVFAFRALELFETRLQRAFRAFHLLDAELLRAAEFQFLNAFLNLHDLLLKQTLPAFVGNGNLFKLRMPDDDGVVIPGCDTGAELLAVPRLKVPFCRHQNVCGRVQTQKLRRPLFGQVVRDGEQGFLTQPKAFALHRGGDHFKGLARADLVGQKRVAAVQNVGDCV